MSKSVIRLIRSSVLATMVDNTTVSKNALRTLSDQYGDKLFDVAIHKSVEAAKSSESGMALCNMHTNKLGEEYMSKKEFGEYVRKLRTERNYTLRRLAAKLEIIPYYLSYIECGIKTNPSKKIISSMFNTFELSNNEIEKFLDLHAKANGCVSYLCEVFSFWFALFLF